MKVSFWNFVTRSDLVASKSLYDWFEDDGIDVMCLVHRLNISQLHGQGRLSTVAWIIKDLESDFRQSKRLLCMARELRLSRGCIDKYLTCLQHSKCFFYLDLEKGCAALLDTSHRSPESTLWSILQEVSRCANAGVADWRSVQDFATCWKGGFAGNSFEQFWTTGCLWTSVSNLSQNDKSTWKWCGLSLSFETVQHDFDHVLYPSHPVR